jgi:PAS domain S-box-containing protein
MTVKDIRPSENVPDFLNVLRSNKEIRVHHNNGIHVKKNGEKINVKVESSLLEFNGYPARLVLVTDITSQLKIEQEMQNSALKLKQSELNLRTIFESTIDGFVLLNISSFIIVFNSKATESSIFNNSKIAFEPGRSIFDYIEDTKRAYFNELLQRVQSGEVIEYKRKFRRKGKTHWVHYTLTPVREGGLITGTCITGRDITEHKQYVQTIEEQNKIFREISWIQSHLVRAPLARLMGLTSLLATETDENEKVEILKLLQLSSNELDEIIKKITGKTTNII